MCGIFGVVSSNIDVLDILIEGLKRLEYRGYDSSGIAILDQETIHRVRSVGKVSQLESKLSNLRFSGSIGIGHTRWATHGRPSEENAHPHMSKHVALVHNGIIENYHVLRAALEDDGFVFFSETDTEVIVYLIEKELSSGATPLEAVQVILTKLKGAFSLVILFLKVDFLIGVCRGSPLVVGYGTHSMFFASDALALAPLTYQLCYLDDGDYVVLTNNRAEVYNNFHSVTRPMNISSISSLAIGKDGYRHFMLKEIFEQPMILSSVLSNYIDFTHLSVKEMSLQCPVPPAQIKQITLSACGSAFYACCVAKYWLEELVGIAIEVDIASEWRYRNPLSSSDKLAIFVSQSGETMDTLEALRNCKAHNQKTLSIVNVAESTLARESDSFFLTHAGPEISVASTKSLTMQLVVLACFTLMLAKEQGKLCNEKKMVEDLITLPRLFSEALSQRPTIERIVHKISDSHDILYIGRGLCYPIAMEGALKLKEISYLHAEGYAAGELKHGPIALVEEGVPVICLMPPGSLFEKMYSNICEVMARSGKVICVVEKGTSFHEQVDTIEMPRVASWLVPILYTLPMQLLAYEVAIHKGTDVDQPRNLAKSVTVE